MQYDDPKISWHRMMCPVCKQATGPDSNCHTLDKKIFGVLQNSNQFLDIFSESCIFRKNYVWNVDINYPFSNTLRDKISAIPGINKIIPIEKYKFQISISPLFDEMEVKRHVTLTYNEFIKSLLTSLPKSEDFIPSYTTITFPNNKSIELFSSNPDEKSVNDAVVSEIFEGISDVKIKKRDNPI